MRRSGPTPDSLDGDLTLVGYPAGQRRKEGTVISTTIGFGAGATLCLWVGPVIRLSHLLRRGRRALAARAFVSRRREANAN